MSFIKVVKNFFSISLIQAINYLVPLVILPYLVKVVGVANFGITNYVLTLFITIKILIDYGYNISGVKEISESKNFQEKLNAIFSKIFFTKLYILLLIFMVLLLTVLCIPSFKNHFYLLLFSFLVVIAQSILPIWFFQGIEKSEILVIFSLLTRLLYLFLIFNYITTPEDYIYINLFLGIADLFLCFFSLIFIFIKYRIKLHFVSYNCFKQEIKSNFVYASSNIFVTISLTMPFLMLGFFSNNIILGYYGIADKIVQVLRTSASILHSAVFPRVINLYNESFLVFRSFIRRLHIFLLTFYISLFLCCLFFSKLIIIVITNATTVPDETILVFRILSIVPLIAALDLLPTHLMFIQQKQKKYATILLFSSFLSAIMSYVLCGLFEYIGAAVSLVLVESFILISLLKINYKQIYKIFNYNGN